VLSFASGRDPVVAILDRARDVATRAIDDGWEGPPFDPFDLAEKLGIVVSPNSDVRDARTRFDNGRFEIELNPLRPRVRQRFSLAHEIAHTLFPDCSEMVRHRSYHSETNEDEWELEALCNIAAAELLMPLGSMREAHPTGNIDQVLDLRKKYQVSTEAVIIRSIQLAGAPLAMFSASRIERGANAGRYKIDYAIESTAWNGEELRAGMLLPPASPARLCTAIGFTQKGNAAGLGVAGDWLECVGVGGYPGAVYPRVVGLLSRPGSPDATRGITYLRGDAVKPQTDGVKVVAFVTNDGTPNWGGGVARQVATRHREVQETFRAAARDDASVLELGSVSMIRATDDLYYAPIVAQHGFGKSATPRIRYQALEAAMRQLGVRVNELEGSLHMPRLGAGAAGGRWDVIEEMVEEYLSPFAPVYVYDLPPRASGPRERGKAWK
jgi:Zn-dependent peptidase ImmA (M78 family)